jgi:hypothetical protein
MPLESIIQNGSSGDEQQPLLSSPELQPADVSSTETTFPSKANLRVILPALMICAFLAAFDLTVLAAIYPIMYVYNHDCKLTLLVARIFKVQIEFHGLLLVIYYQTLHFNHFMDDFPTFLEGNLAYYSPMWFF